MKELAGRIDESIGRANLHPLSTPTKHVAGRWISFPKQIDPEGIGDLWLELVRLDGNVFLLGHPAHALQ